MGDRTKPLILAVAAMLLMAVPPAAAQTPSDTTYLHDYLTPPNDTNCTNDVTAEVQQAASDAVMAGVARTGGRLELGSGCYLVNGTVNVERTDDPNAGYSLQFVGNGPNNTVFKRTLDTGGRTLQFNELSGGKVAGFTLQGPRRYQARGLIFASRHANLGSCCFVVEDVTVTDYNTCYQFGDDSAPQGAAADITVISATASRCQWAYALFGANTIGLQFVHSSATESNIGWQTSGGSGQAQQVTWNGGGGEKLNTTFALWGNGTFTISNFRDEPKTLTTPRIVGGSGGGGQWNISQYTAVDWSGPISITSNGGSNMALRQNFLVGQVQITGNQNGITGTIDASQNKLYTTADSPWDVPLGTELRSFGDCKPDLVFGQCQTYWP